MVIVIYNSDSLYDSNATAICMDDPYIIKDTAESICIPLKIFPEKPLFSNYAAVFTKIPFAKNVFKYSCYGHCHRSSTVNPLLYGSICIWKNQISGKKYYFWNIACCTDGSIIFFYPATVSDDTENGIVKHNTGVIYTGIVQCFWNISDETVFYGTSETNWKMRRELTVAIIL